MKRLIKKKYTKDKNNVITKTTLYDKNENILYIKDLDEFEENFYYNELNLLIHYTNSSGEDITYEYDKEKRLIRIKSLESELVNIYDDGYYHTIKHTSVNEKEIYDTYIKYDDNNNCIYAHNIKTDFKFWKEYDENNNLISYRNSDGIKEIYEYDKTKHEILMKRISNNKEPYERFKKYDSENNIIELKDSNGNIEYYEYEFYD